MLTTYVHVCFCQAAYNMSALYPTDWQHLLERLKGDQDMLQQYYR